MQALKDNIVPLIAFGVVAVLLWRGTVTVEQAVVLLGAIALPGVKGPEAAK